MQRLPAFTCHAAAGLLRALPPATWDKLLDWTRLVLPKCFQSSKPGENARKLADVLTFFDGHIFCRQLTPPSASHWPDPASIAIGAIEPKTLLIDATAWPKTDSPEHAMMAKNAQTYMADDILL